MVTNGHLLSSKLPVTDCTFERLFPGMSCLVATKVFLTSITCVASRKVTSKSLEGTHSDL